jgi:type II secretory pathway pseudopilin PulG
VKDKKNLGFTLVELLIGFTIIALLMLMLIGTINPIALVNKGRDSKRKSDLNMIKRAFEEYFNDKGEYPLYTDLIAWNTSDNCGKTVSFMGKYLRTWPCDPSGQPYNMVSKDNWFKVVTNLDNKKDDDIPYGWYDQGTYGQCGFNKEAVNYGVSSTNVLWYEGGGVCDETTCFKDVGCNDPINGICDESSGEICFQKDFYGVCNNPVCEVSHCNN